jgi:hypothetical protein
VYPQVQDDEGEREVRKLSHQAYNFLTLLEPLPGPQASGASPNRLPVTDA